VHTKEAEVQRTDAWGRKSAKDYNGESKVNGDEQRKTNKLRLRVKVNKATSIFM